MGNQTYRGRRSKLKLVFINLLLSMMACAVTIISAEIMLRFTSVGHYSLNRRVLFYSRPSFVRLTQRAVAYHPNTVIRTVAIYGNHIEYDTSNRTNSLGFFDSVSYQTESNVTPTPATSAEKRKVAFVGDSFTAGSGGTEPWVSLLRRRVTNPNLELYNLGVSGTGVQHYLPLLNELQPQLQFDAANFALISSDFFRIPWYPMIDDEGVRFCRSDQNEFNCRATTPIIIYHFDLRESQQSLLNRAQQIYAHQNTDNDSQKTFLQRSRVFNLVCDGVFGLTGTNDSLLTHCPHLHRYIPNSYEKNTLFKQSLQVLKKIKIHHPNLQLRVLHIPEKNEVRSGRYAVNIVSEMQELDIDYVPLLFACNFDLSMFHKHDAHMNDSGYQHLAKCTSQYPL